MHHMSGRVKILFQAPSAMVLMACRGISITGSRNVLLRSLRGIRHGEYDLLLISSFRRGNMNGVCCRHNSAVSEVKSVIKECAMIIAVP
jgi:hypothetical protein